MDKFIRMRTQYAGPLGTCKPGDTMAVPAEEADRLIRAGYAMEPETGMQRAPETAVQRRGPAPGTEPKPLARMNKAELQAAAGAEGVSLTGEETNAEIAAAIEAKRSGASAEESAGTGSAAGGYTVVPAGGGHFSVVDADGVAQTEEPFRSKAQAQERADELNGKAAGAGSAEARE